MMASGATPRPEPWASTPTTTVTRSSHDELICRRDRDHPATRTKAWSAGLRAPRSPPALKAQIHLGIHYEGAFLLFGSGRGPMNSGKKDAGIDAERTSKTAAVFVGRLLYPVLHAGHL